MQPFLHRNRKKCKQLKADSPRFKFECIIRQIRHYSMQLKCKNNWINNSVFCKIWLELRRRVWLDFCRVMFILRRGPLWVKARRQVQQQVERGAAATERPVEKQRRPSHLRSLHTFTNYILLAADKLFMWALAFFFFPRSRPLPLQ